MLEAIQRRYPMGRFARPEEIANGVLCLALDASSCMTGAALVVDRGIRPDDAECGMRNGSKR